MPVCRLCSHDLAKAMQHYSLIPKAVVYRIPILGVPFDPVTMSEALTIIGQYLDSDKLHLVVTPNPEICLLAVSDPAYTLLLHQADLSIADGFGILWAGRYLRGSRNIFRWFWTCYVTFWWTKRHSPFPERVTGTDLMREVCKKYSNRKVFLLGASEESNSRTAELLTAHFGTNVVGSFTGNPSEQMEEEIIARICNSGPDILFVAFGAPQQEQWIYRNRDMLKGVRVAIGIGGAFDFLSGTKSRAPFWVRRLGFEWLYRLCIEPSRWRRIASAFFVFPFRVLTYRQK
jgi:N-acetylglucosaminyldiphosphoundecaprenol N-acetyl-beta-D-mannosaminyltransferase